MDGVTVLNIYQQYSIFGGVFLAFGVVMTVGLVTAALFTFEDNVMISGICWGLAILFIVGCFSIKQTDTLYEVTLDDSVSWNEFSEHYHIVKVRGQIITVMEREQKDETD